jgi:hypothetical protein
MQAAFGSTLLSDVTLNPFEIRVEEIRKKFANYKAILKPEDTFVMYSHSHGLNAGLGINWGETGQNLIFNWDEYAKAIVDLPARNVVIFNMSCHSGYLTEALNKISAEWKSRRVVNKRNLIVLTAVSKEQLSSPTNMRTGINDIGNPFTYAVRSALGGSADGAVNGVKDGKTSMDELVNYVLKTAKEKSTGQSAKPQFAGEYSPADQFLP